MLEGKQKSAHGDMKDKSAYNGKKMTKGSMGTKKKKASMPKSGGHATDPMYLMNDDIDFSMFEPTGRDMRKDFPELKNYPEFEDLKSREIRFCWYMGNKTSPLVTKKMKGEALVKSAIELCYDERAKEHNPTVISMLSGDIPQDILSGISRMASFSPSYRLRAKWMNEYVFDKLNSLIIVDAMAEAEMKSDADAKKKYADLAIKISSEMPELVQRMESGYGVKLVKKNTKSGEPLTKLSELTDRIK